MEKENQPQENEWYKKWWFILIAIIVLIPFLEIVIPVVIIWFIWAKTKWNKKTKGWATVAFVIFLTICLAIYGSKEKKIETVATTQSTTQAPQAELQQSVSDTQEIKSDNADNLEQKPEEKSIEIPNENIPILFKVVRVVDGDTLDIDMNGTIERIRLIGMDTPETVDPRKVVQCFGKEASDKAKEMLNEKMVSIEADKSQGERDSYKRLLRYVYLEDGTFFNKYMIAEGYAHEYTYQSNPYKYQLEFKEAEKQARETAKGLWSPDSCNGNTTQAAIVNSADNSNSSETISSTTTTMDNSAGSVVKKSKTGICHAPGTTYYSKTKSFTPYNSIDECLKSGGRLPLR